MLTLKLSSSQSLAEEKAPAPALYSLPLLLLQTLAISFQLYTASTARARHPTVDAGGPHSCPVNGRPFFVRAQAV